MIAKKETPKGLLFKSSNFCGFQILEQKKCVTEVILWLYLILSK